MRCGKHEGFPFSVCIYVGGTILTHPHGALLLFAIRGNILYGIVDSTVYDARLVSEMFNLRMRGGHASNKLSMVGTVTLCDVKRSVAVSAMLDILLYLASRVFTLPLTGD